MRRTHVLVLAIAVGLAAIITLRWRDARRDSPPAVEEPPDTMDEARFWSVIEPLKSLAVDEREPSLAAVLVELPPEDVQMFAAEYQKVMNRAYTWDLWPTRPDRARPPRWLRFAESCRHHATARDHGRFRGVAA